MQNECPYRPLPVDFEIGLRLFLQFLQPIPVCAVQIHCPGGPLLPLFLVLCKQPPLLQPDDIDYR